MKRVIFAIFCLAGSYALADEGDETGAAAPDAVDLRVEVLEQIDVTAAKEPVSSDDDLDAGIEAIILDAEALETSDPDEC